MFLYGCEWDNISFLFELQGETIKKVEKRDKPLKHAYWVKHYLNVLSSFYRKNFNL